MNGRGLLDPRPALDDNVSIHHAGHYTYYLHRYELHGPPDGMKSASDSMSTPEPRPLRILTLNISGPSTERGLRLLDTLELLDVDLLVLTETRDNAGTRMLLDAYRERDYVVISPIATTAGERGAAVIHRLPVDTPPSTRAADLAQRLVVTRVGDRRPFTVVGAYVPSRDTSPGKILRKQTFLNQLISLLSELPPEEDLLLLGDFNIVGRSHVPRYSTFRSWEYDAIEAIETIGLVDAFALLNPGIQAHSWIGRKGDGYRYDYVFASAGLIARIRACNYLHDFRLKGLSDHAGLLTTLNGSPAELEIVSKLEPITA